MDFNSLCPVDEHLGGTARKELKDFLWNHSLSGSAI
jgi:hypothetical protein